MPTYKVKKNLKYNGTRYVDGDVTDIDEKNAAILEKSGAIELIGDSKTGRTVGDDEDTEKEDKGDKSDKEKDEGKEKEENKEAEIAKMTKKQLVKITRQMKIKLTGKETKKVLLGLIEKAGADKGKGGDDSDL